MLYGISPSAVGWIEEGRFFSDRPSSLSAPARVLLLSDGSLVRLLSALFLSPIKIERLRQEEATLDKDMASYIGAGEGRKVIERDVWLMCGDKRLVYASSILPLSTMKAMGGSAYYEITKGDTPLGTLLSDHSILTRRDRLQIARIRSKEMSRELGIPEDTEFWCRRYRLHTGGGGGGAITEVFSPGLFEEMQW